MSIILVLSLIIIVNFINIIFDREKKTIGILSSFGISKFKIMIPYFFDVFIIMIFSIILASTLEIFVLYLLNLMVVKVLFINLKLVFYSFISLLIIFILYLIYILVLYLITNHKLKKKKKIDLIYQR